MTTPDKPVRVLANDRPFAYLGNDGTHVHVDANTEAAVPADVARDLVFYGSAKYLSAGDAPKDLMKLPVFFATDADIRAAQARRAHAERMAQARGA